MLQPQLHQYWFIKIVVLISLLFSYSCLIFSVTHQSLRVLIKFAIYVNLATIFETMFVTNLCQL